MLCALPPPFPCLMFTPQASTVLVCWNQEGRVVQAALRFLVFRELMDGDRLQIVPQ